MSNPLVKLYDAGKAALSRRFNGEVPKRFDEFVANLNPREFGQGFIIDLKKDRIYAAGYNQDGRLATEDYVDIIDGFKMIPSLSQKGIIDIDIYQSHALALTSAGSVLSWGRNDDGQLGYEGVLFSLTPRKVEFGEAGIKIKSIAAGRWRSFALTQDGLVYEWGQGNAKRTPHLVDATAIGPVKKLYATAETAFVLTTNQRLFAWGTNNITCGTGDDKRLVKEPTLVALDFEHHEVKQFAPAQHISAILTKENLVFTWGHYKNKLSTPTKLLFDTSKVQSLISTGDGIVMLFSDDSALVLKPGTDHQSPTLVTSSSEAWQSGLKIRWSDVMVASFQDISDLFEKDQLANFLLESSKYEDVSDQFNNEATSDIVFAFEAAEKDEAMALHAHTQILSQRSSVFRERFEHGWDKTKEVPTKFSYKVFCTYIFYLYARKLKIISLTVRDLIELFDLAEQYFESSGFKWAIRKQIWVQLNKVNSVEELIETYRKARGHKDIENYITNRLGMVISMDEMIEIAELAVENGDQYLIYLISHLIFDGYHKISLTIDLTKFDANLLETLRSAHSQCAADAEAKQASQS